MRSHKRARATPAVETLEGKTLMAATIGGFHTFQTDSGATITVEKERFQARDGRITLELQVRGGGRRFHEFYSYESSGGDTIDPPATIMSTFLDNALARATGSSGAGF